MDELISNILRGSVSSVMYVVLLFTLTKSRFGHKSTIFVAIFIFLINIGSTIWFYLYGDLTGLSRFTLVLFLIVGLALKSLTRLNFMEWCFTFLTTINIAMIIIILSFHLARMFPMPQYTNTFFRLALYLVVIILFKKYLLPLYRSVVNNWSIFSVLMICIFVNLSYYFYVTDDIQYSLLTYKWPLLLLVSLSLAAYGTVFYAMKKFSFMSILETENLKIQTERGVLYQQAKTLEKYAHYDSLTGLPNRRFLIEKLEQVVADNEKSSRPFALLYIDLDGFKDINDNYGHKVGDEVLITLGIRMLHCISKQDVVARIGGDEFAILVCDIRGPLQAENLAEEIHSRVQEPMFIDSIECRVNSSIGIATYPDEGESCDALLKNADSAMYAIKKKGKGGIGIAAHPLS